MANNRNPSEKQPGEKVPGKYHYNPGRAKQPTLTKTKPSSPTTLIG
jgi:hypothetical protein